MARFFSEYPAIEPRGQVTTRSLSRTCYSADNTSCQLRIDTKSDALLAFSIEGPVIPPAPLNGDLVLNKEELEDFYTSREVKEIIKKLSEQKQRADNIKREAGQRCQQQRSTLTPLHIRWQCNDKDESPDYCSVYFGTHKEAKEDYDEGELLQPFEEDTAEEDQSQVDDLHDTPELKVAEVISNNTIVCKFPDMGCHPIPANPNTPWYSSPSENSDDDESEDDEPEAGKGSPDEGSGNTQQGVNQCHKHLLCSGQPCRFKVVVAPAESTEPNMEPPAKSVKIKLSNESQNEWCDSTTSQSTNRQTVNTEFLCSECSPPRNFRNQNSLSSHTSQCHTGEKTCPYCQKTLPNAQTLYSHKRKDHTGEQNCPHCQKTLPNKKALSDHKIKEHTGEKTCPYCQKTLPNKKALSDHKRIHRKRKPNDVGQSD
ncbi:C2H2-type zinc finger protein [Endozoicomonas gorgoniicola]|uniref:C2H2-type zinc finger protein n=1 Tax=Endozoicomonas gorgoniicola TaxID=1234144 RepID=A0ABT3MVQ1_9GAMM|nr:C2H2-type zinc finger protein [Endozoicomonas gorgoniicola]MCW7553452.1 C2H2-type zinc finger protein [Endozoicomonas gorgoniicola]